MFKLILIIFILLISNINLFALNNENNEKEISSLQDKFNWWPTDAMPGPVKDEKKAGYWWWPNKPGKALPWGNRGYIYLYKIIYDYKAEDIQDEEKKEENIIKQEEPILKPSLLIKRIIKNVKIYFDFNKFELRDDASDILLEAVKSLRRNPESNILITGNCDKRGSIEYNERLGNKRAQIVKDFMIENGIESKYIKIISRGKLDAVAPVNDIAGMQKDRNVQFMIAEVEEILLPKPELEKRKDIKYIEQGKFLLERKEAFESKEKVSIREYTVKKGDSLAKIAQEQLGAWHRWQYLYELNKDKIKDPKKIKIGLKIIIPIE